MLTLLILLDAHALPGTHAPVVATWDTRASTLGVAAHTAVMPSATLSSWSYLTDFSNTQGKLSSQFGVHFLQLKVDSWQNGLYGGGANATTMFNQPLTRRYDNGLPIVAVAPSLSLAPNVLLNGERNHLSVPLNLGVGVSWAPKPWLVVTPNAEWSTSFDFDTHIDAYEYMSDDSTDDTVELSQQDIEEILEEAVTWEATVGGAWRAGLAITATLWRFDLQIDGGVLNLGSDTSQTLGRSLGWWSGMNVLWQWDRVVPAVLPYGICELPVGHPDDPDR